MARATKADKQATKDLLVRIRTRSKAMFDADSENRQKALEDLRFLHIPGEQWDASVKNERGDLRPIYEFNKLRITVKRIVNDMRANRPQGKVRAVEDGDKPTANVFEGLIRNIWNVSDGDTVIDQAAEYQVGGGMGAWRVVTEFTDDEAFDQTISLKAIRNPFCLYADNAAQDILKRDAMDWVLTEKISKATFKSRWPDADPVSFDDVEFDDDDDWEDEEKIRICEYWWKEPYNKTLLLLSNGATVEAGAEDGTPEAIAGAGLQVVKERAVRCHKVMMCIAGGGNRLLEKPTEWAGKEFPFVLIYGENVVVDGRTHWFGLTRFGKDAQKSYNYSRTNAIESVALAPQAKWWATAEQAKGLVNQWAVAHKTNMPFMVFNADPRSPGPPVRMGSADVPIALVQEMQHASEDIKAVTGIYDASLGAQGNETSGKAINARQRQGEIATFNYMDNMAKGIRRTWEILIDLVPKIYDTERSVRILGHDGAEDYAKVNTIDPQTGNAINDLNHGKYDVTVTVGPSFATLRQEAAEAYGEIASRDPNVMMAAGDLVFKAMDLPYAEQIAERYQALLPPPIQNMITKGKQLPPEVQAAMAQVQQMSQMVDQKGQLVTAAEQELKELQASAQSDKAGSQLAAANLKTQEAHLASLQKDLEMAQAQLDNERAILAKETENAILRIQLAHEKATNSLASKAHQQDLQNQATEHALSNQARDVDGAVLEAEHTLSDRERDVQETAKDAQHGLEKQATSIQVSAMQAAHKQDMKAAKVPKPSA
jgi:hypothetical protein